MNRWVGKVAIVTGANGGIGSVITEELVKAGVLVVGLDKRLEKLEELSSSLKDSRGKLYARECDLRKEEDILNAFKWVNADLGGVDILVNNAGVVAVAKILDDDIDSLRNILDVNVLAMTIGIREAVASMKSRDVPGYIININSITGHKILRPGVNLSLYQSSKHAVTALTETVRRELASEPNNKIKITSISPGFVETELVADVNNFFEVNVFLDPKDISDVVIYVLGTRNEVQVTEMTVQAAGEIF